MAQFVCFVSKEVVHNVNITTTTMSSSSLPLSVSTGKRRSNGRCRPLLVFAVLTLTALSLLAWMNLLPTARLNFSSTSSTTSTASSSSLKYSNDAAVSKVESSTSADNKVEAEEVIPIKQSTSLVDQLALSATRAKDGNLYPPTYIPSQANTFPRVNAGFIVLVRNSELEDMKSSMRNVEYRFNRKYGYPWIFLNDEPFTEEFKAGVRKITRSEIRFGQVPKEHWSYPSWISEEKAAETREKMKNVVYGSSESYRHMCRWNSGFFFRHPLTLELDYYWRVEPGIKLFCDVDYDPFAFMMLNNKTYGFTITAHEFRETVPTLWKETQAFMAQHPEHIAPRNSMKFLTETSKTAGDWNACHFWSNFEIGDLNFYRSKAYMDYFEHLDKQGGFFYERWGDAPVHTIAAGILQDKSKVHHFDDIGYKHSGWDHCPANQAYHDEGRCDCERKGSFDRHSWSCLNLWWKYADEGYPSYTVP